MLPRRTFALSLLLCAALGLFAQGPGRIPMRVMGPEEGLANPLVNCMAQSGDGFVWVGTWSGLFRTEGHRFELVEGPGGTVVDMAVDPQGDLWVGTERNLAVRRGGRFALLGAAEGLPAAEGAYRRILSTPEGIFLIREGRGYRSGDGAHFEAIPLLGMGDLHDLAWAPKRGGLLALDARGLIRVKDGESLSLPALGREDALLQVAEDREGWLWLLSRQGLWRQPAGEGAWEDQRRIIPQGIPLRLNAGVGGGVVLHHPSGARWVMGTTLEVYPRQEFQAAPGVGASMVDREGALWLGAYGVQRTLGGGLWRVYGESEGLPAPGAWSYLRDRKGRLWVGNGKGLCLGTPTGWKVLLPGLQILSVREDASGWIWATGGPQDCVHRIHPDSLAVETLRLPTTAPTQLREVVTGVDADQVWVYPRWQVPGWAFHGQRRSGGWSWSPVKSGGQALTGVNYMAKAPGGRIFLTAPGGLYEVEGAEARLVMGRPREWAPQYVVFAPDGELFLGQNESRTILRFEPEGRGFRPSGRVELPPSTSVYLVFTIAVDARGYLWAGTSEGLMRYHLGSGQVLRWTSSEGLPNNDCNALGIFPQPNGDTWVSTAGGIGLYLGSKERIVGDLPAPLITSVRLQGSPLALGSEPLELGSRPGTAEFHFQSLHFGLQGRIRYQVRIVGLNPEWESIDDAAVALRALEPGTYRLEIRSYLPEGLRSPVTALSFRVAPAWWQTLVARIGALVAGLVAVLALVRFWNRQLQRRNLALERAVALRTDEVGRINTELILAKEQAEQANRSKSAFLANMSHELRTPLNAILLYCELLLDSARDSGNAEDEKDLIRVRGAGNHLLTLINGLLDLAKIEAGRMTLHLEEVPLQPLFDEVLATLRPIVEASNNVLELQVEQAPASMWTEATKLKQILFNLLSNACKFTREGRIVLKVQREGDQVRFEIADTGIGMTPEQLERIFQDFVQAGEDISRQYGGTGLGLTISRRLCELMGGRIGVTSAAGQGTTFRVTLPIHARSAEPAPRAAGGSDLLLASDGGKPKALVIDGDPVRRDFLTRHLSREGYWVATALGGEEGLALALHVHPRLVVLALELAMAEGWSLLGRIQQDPKLSQVPVLLEAQSESGDRAVAFFAPELLRLPFHSGAIGPLLTDWRPSETPGHVVALCPDEESRRALQSLAHRHGWTLEASEHADGILDALQRRRPELLLVDLQSGGGEAWALLEELPRNPDWRDLRVVGLTLSDRQGPEEDLNAWRSQKIGRSREALASGFSELLRSKVGR